MELSSGPMARLTLVDSGARGSEGGWQLSQGQEDESHEKASPYLQWVGGLREVWFADGVGIEG